MDFEIIGVVGEPVGRRHPQTGPGIHVAVRGENRVAGAGVHLDHVVILFSASEVTFAIRGFRPLGGVVQSPILTVDVKMIKVAAFGRLVLGQLRIPRKLVAQADEPVVAFETPGVILKRSQVIAVERVHSALARERLKFQPRCAVLPPEEEAERVLRIGRARMRRPALI